jgi:serine/threonine-protein kinase
MGVVFRALDTKLHREVALKLLPAHVASDSERMARFQREAQLLASLNHPNIAQIHGLEDSTAQWRIVMELVEGETLQARLKRGPVSWGEARPLAKQICDALEAAHDRGVIHRDLKPANIKLTPDGTVKVLDFGLAKAVDAGTASAAASNSPTLSMAATNAGVILGTAAYMSPQQAWGRAVDRRTDIFAFGCVLFEMLSGRPAFDGDDVTEILGRVVTAEPDWSKLPADVPASIIRLIHRDTIGSTYDTILSAYTGTPGSFAPVACDDDAAGTTGVSKIALQVTAGMTYSFMVSQFNVPDGMLSCTPPFIRYRPTITFKMPQSFPACRFPLRAPITRRRLN